MLVRLTNRDVYILDVSGVKTRYERGDTFDIPDLKWASMSAQDRSPFTPTGDTAIEFLGKGIPVPTGTAQGTIIVRPK
jgi:hypothetical protein